MKLRLIPSPFNFGAAFFSESGVVSFRDISASVQRVEQIKAYWCGAACSTMVASYFEKPILQEEAFQKIFDAARHEAEQLWSDPLGISAFLTDHISTKAGNAFRDYSSASAQDIVSRIFYNANILKLPSVTLVQEGRHWVVIDSVRISENEVGERQVVGVEIENPWYGKKSNFYVSLPELLRSWLTPCKYGTTWQGKVVTISDSRVPESFRLPTSMFMQHNPPGLDLLRLDPKTVVEASITQLNDIGYSGVKEIISGGGAPVLETVKVKVLGTENHYFISPLDATSNAEIGDYIYVAVDAYGALLEYTALQGPLNIFDDGELEEMLRRSGLSYDTIDSEVFWAPSYELMSRFDVVRRVWKQDKPFYVLPDARILPSLDTNLGKGG